MTDRALSYIGFVTIGLALIGALGQAVRGDWLTVLVFVVYGAIAGGSMVAMGAKA